MKQQIISIISNYIWIEISCNKELMAQ